MWYHLSCSIFFFMVRRHPSSTRTDTLFPYPTLFRSIDDLGALLRHAGIDDATPVTLAVPDWGGMIGFGWALSHMPQVKRLVVPHTAAFPLPTAQPMPSHLSLTRDSSVGCWRIRRFNLVAPSGAWLGTTRHLPPRAHRVPPPPRAGRANP